MDSDQSGKERRRSPRASCRLHCRVLAGKERSRARIVDVSEGGLCLLSPSWVASKSMIHISIDVPGRGESIVEAQVWHVRRQKMHGGMRKVWAIGVMLEETDDAYQRLLSAAGVAPEQESIASPEAGRPSVSRSPRPNPPPTDSASFERRTASETKAISNPEPPSATPAPSVSPAAAATSSSSSASAQGSVSEDAGQGERPEDLIEPKIFRIRVKATAGPRTKVLTLAADSEEEARSLATRDLEARWTILEVKAA
ncbi:MAG: PilZ domain-containing protein [Myxococcota bacterium]